MASDAFEARLGQVMKQLTEYPDRHVGSPGNHAATALFATAMADLGYTVRATPFDCVEWEFGAASIIAQGREFEVQVGPYSLPCVVTAPLVTIDSVEALEALDSLDTVILLHGQIAKAQVMPKNFTFYNPESHKRIIRALEAARPAAVIAATGKDPEMVGSQYPFPLFEDGDLNIPNAYMRDVEGLELAAFAGTRVKARIESRRIPSTAEHIVATKPGSGQGRIVLSAHIDSRKGSPGALDNATGVAALMGAAELLAEQELIPTLELVPFNGEDNYANPGEMMWVGENAGRFDEIVLGVNVDDAAALGYGDHVSFYGCSEELAGQVHAAIRPGDGITEGPQWFQSDHAILGIYGVPAIAIASEGMHEFMAQYAHTERDTLELADIAAIARIAGFIARVVENVGRSTG